MTLLIQKPCQNEKERQKYVRQLEAQGWSVNVENTDDDNDYDEEDLGE